MAIALGVHFVLTIITLRTTAFFKHAQFQSFSRVLLFVIFSQFAPKVSVQELTLYCGP